MRKLLITLTALLVSPTILLAAPVKGLGKRETTGLNKTAAGCNATTAVIDLDINNVRAHLMDGGDMWWDIPTSTASYEVPKGSNKNSLFAGSIWIGGIDRGSQDLKVAAQTYRQSGNDYWSGPLENLQGGSITFQTCAEWDRFWKINAADVNKFRSFYAGITDPNQIQTILVGQQALVPNVIKEWPARGNQEIKGSGGGFIAAPSRDMAPFVDIDSNGIYEWRKGDYPKILGDQFIWWVFNDKGDAKTETTSEAIGLEIHASAFAFATNDCLNEATFYNYKVYNGGTSALDSTYMATWCDADLGYAFDDYVGCDTARGLGILYNGDSYDEGAQGYGFEIPMVGVDYFEGPKYKNPITGKDTELKMTVFTYYNNVSGAQDGNPDVKDDYYQYITGSWKNGTSFTTSCDAKDASYSKTKFIFYGDPCKGGWTESSCANTPNDRRFIHSSGPFTLDPGVVNNITIGAVWVPNVGGGSSACFSKIQICDDKAQDLFDNNFKLPFGPQAPKVVVQPLDRKLVFDLDNLPSSNNFNEMYGSLLSKPDDREPIRKAVKLGLADSLYQFEGYLVYQLKNESVALSDIRSKDGSVNTDKARLVFQCDKRNGVKDVLNFEVDPEVSTDYYVPKLLASGKDSGIVHSFQLTNDAFATGTSKKLVNYKSYYYVVVAYAYNNFRAFNSNKVDSTQDRQYIESRTDGRDQPITVIKAMPHPATDSLYIQTYADYGTGIQLTRIEGKGNSGVAMELTDESEAEAISAPNYQSFNPTYKPNRGPAKIFVVNPDSLKAGKYELRLHVDSFYTSGPDTSLGAKAQYTKWSVINTTTQDTVMSDVTITDHNEKYLRKYNMFDWGIAASMKQQTRPGDNPGSTENGLITSTVLFDDINDQWLSGIPDADGRSLNNWIRAGIEFQANSGPEVNDCSMIDWDNGVDFNTSLPIINNKDQLGTFENVVGGTFSPYNLTYIANQDECGFGLMYGNGSDRSSNRLQDVYSIDIVFTDDKSLWSRCPVIEMTAHVGVVSIAEGNAFKYNIRKHLGWNKDVDAQGNPVYSTSAADSGMSYFPGYAVNIETGERLNIYFAEESFNTQDRGRDMIWNPTSRAFDPITGDLKWGGKHIIYVARTKYDGGAAFAQQIRKGASGSSDPDLRAAYKTIMWAGVPRLRPGASFAPLKDGLIPTKTRVQIRVTRPYAQYQPDPNTQLRNNGWPLYTFDTKDLLPAKLGDSRNDYSNNKDEIFKRIHVVPNPYYAYSEYEGTRVENKVRIINLPDQATIKIFTIDGSLIKTINKNDNKTNYVDWDIKNEKGIPIASGMYLVHVNLPGVGETVLKWFGAMRPIDLISF
ncbi:MAG: T9SS type A sorting domain-containing protein [Chitinophagaceae bacterium]|nr:T9SS type A sorting domain-containing protein [Chitinophagaceae bacterium]